MITLYASAYTAYIQYISLSSPQHSYVIVVKTGERMQQVSQVKASSKQEWMTDPDATTVKLSSTNLLHRRQEDLLWDCSNKATEE